MEYKRPLEEFTDQRIERPDADNVGNPGKIGGGNALATEEDAEIKRAVLQLIYASDY